MYEIPFSKTSELKQIAGFFNNANQFQVYEPQLRLTVPTIVKYIGKETYKLAITHYKTDFAAKTKPVYDEIVYWVQTALVYFTYIEHQPLFDINHDDNGRNMLVSEERKNVFEWQVNRAEETSENLAFKALENLLAHLLENASTIPEFLQSANYQAITNQLVKNPDTYAAIEILPKPAVFFFAVLPILNRLQEEKIESRIFPILYNYITGTYDTTLYKLENSRLTYSDEDIEYVLTERQIKDVISTAQKALVYLSYSEAVTKFPYEIMPQNVTQPFVSDRATSKAKAALTETVISNISNDNRLNGEEQLEKLERLVKHIETACKFSKKAIATPQTTQTPRHRTDYSTKKYVRL